MDKIVEQISDAAPLFELRGIGKTFGGFRALEDVNLSLERGEIHCILGENGAGKSTLCNLIFGVHQPSEGAMLLDGKPHKPSGPRHALDHGIAMVHQHFSLSKDLTVLDNLLLGQTFGRPDRKSAAERINSLAANYGLKLDMAADVADLSIGERQRVEIVKALIRRPRLLILDEPTAVLLPQEIDSLLRTCRRVAQEGCAVVLVTHKLNEIKSAADRVTVLRAGKTVASSDKPANEIDELVTAMIGRSDLPGERPRRPQNQAQRTREVMQADGLTYLDDDGFSRLDSVSFTVAAGEVVGIAGVEGNGQSELGEILAGLLRPTSGHWYVGEKDLSNATTLAAMAEGVGIVPEDRHRVAVANGLSLADNMLNNRLRYYTRWGLLDRNRMRGDASRMMEQFDVRATGPDATMSGLSGGNQQKAVLARELTTPGLRFLLAAQPTRGLDVGAVDAVYRLIREACDKGVGVLLISSELDEVLSVADRILVMYRGRIVARRAAHSASRDEIGALMAGHEAGAAA